MTLIIIGGGPGAYETAIKASARGLNVTLITEGPLGGTCLNEGCIPTKTFCHFAEGLNGETFSIEAMESLQSRKAEVIARLQGGIASMLKGVNVVYGHAEFADAHTLRVGDQLYSADNIIIATGSYNYYLPIPGAELCIDSTDILNLTQVPDRLCIIGGGVIGCEFASIFKAFGSEVSILEYCPGILPRFDSDLAKRLKMALKKRGIDIQTGAKVCSVSKVADGLEVKYLLKDKEYSLCAGAVLMAAGRRPNVGSLNLADVGIEFSPAGISVDPDTKQTSIEHIYAVGDISGGIMLAHFASFEGERALNHICGCADNIRFDICPAAVFTVPELATVGLSEEDCAAQGLDYKVHKGMYGGNGKAVSMGLNDGFLKIISAKADGKILGAHIMGAHASDLIHEVATLMNFDATLAQARAIIHAHPSLSEVLQTAYNS